MAIPQILRSDVELEQAIQMKHNVEVHIGGAADYMGPLFGYDSDTILVDEGFQYLRRNVEIRRY